MDINKAFTYIFEDENWLSKAGLGAVISIVPILNFCMTGYVIQLMRRVSKGEPRPLLSWDDFGKKFMDGLMVFLATLIYSLPILVLLCLLLVTVFVPVIVTSSKTSQGAVNASAIGGVTGLICLAVIFILYSIAFSIISQGIYIMYAREGTFSSCFKLREIFALIREHASPYFGAWAICLGMGIVISGMAGFLGAILFWLPFIPAILGILAGVYILLVQAHLFGQILGMETEIKPITAA